MKTSNIRARQTAFIAVGFFIVGKLVFSRLFALFEPTIDDIHFRITERAGQFPTSILFAIMMGIIPLLVLFIWRFGPVVSIVRKLAVLLVIISLMIAGIFVRHQLVKNYFNGIVRPFLLNKHQLPMDYPIDPANFVYYMFVGCCIGCIVSFFLFRQKISNKGH